MEKNRKLLEASQSNKQSKDDNPNVGDYVRIKLKKALFSKLGRNYSQEIYKVIKVNKFSVKLENYDKLVRISDIQIIPKDTINVDNQEIKRVENDHTIQTRLRKELGLSLWGPLDIPPSIPEQELRARTVRSEQVPPMPSASKRPNGLSFCLILFLFLLKDKQHSDSQSDLIFTLLIRICMLLPILFIHKMI